MKKLRTSKAAGKAASAAPGRASIRIGRVSLVLLDEAPIRAQAVSDYHALEEQVATLRQSLEAFEEGDMPAYHRWEAVTLGPMLTELRAVQEELEQKRHILIMVADEIFWTGCTRVKAYQRVMKELKNPRASSFDPFEEPFEEDSVEREVLDGLGVFGESDLPPGMTAADFDKMSPRDKREFREYYEEMAEMFEIITDRKAPDFDEVIRRSRQGGPAGKAEPPPRAGRRDAPPPRPAPAPAPPVTREGERLKDLYRTLVRKLHPDKGGGQTARERELWHQLQEAYRKNDLEAMESLAGRLEVSLNGDGRHLPVQILLRMTRDLREVLAGMESQIGKLKALPAWNFRSRTKKLAKLAETRQRKLRQEIAAAKAELEICRRELDVLTTKAEETEAKKKKRQAAKRPLAAQEEFGF